MSKKKGSTHKLPTVHPDLVGLDIQIDSLGKVNSLFDLDKLTLFLNKHTEDKKYKDDEKS